MKKIFPILLIIILFNIFAVPFDNVAYASDNEDSAQTEENLDKTVNDTLNDIDLSGYDELLAFLNQYSDVSIAVSIRKLIDDVLYNRVEFDFRYFMKFSTEILIGDMLNILPQLLIIVVIALLFSILQNLNSGFAKADTQKIVYMACFGLILTVVTVMVTGTITNAVRFFSFMEKFNDVCFPVLVTLIAALGGSATAAVYQPLVLVFGSILMKLISFVIMPLFYITFVFGLVGNLSDNIKLDKFSKTVKSAANWIMGISFSLFITFMTAQGITGVSFDSLAAKGAKFALSSYVPIVGSYLKDGFDIVLAGCVVVKNAIGLCSIIILLFMVLVPVIKILVISFGIKLTASVIEPISDAKYSSALFVVADSMKILITAVLCTAFSALIMLMMIIITFNFGAI